MTQSTTMSKDGARQRRATPKGESPSCGRLEERRSSSSPNWKWVFSSLLPLLILRFNFLYPYDFSIILGIISYFLMCC
ncbi:hypothetical protein MTR67_038674 [Solanum verrucosum]|uniref:Uncharacterized protein n=1 Tax=Solanum verrucosum TaxID=315347 RepID=A0AAF0ZQG0_SOLVR|nr:hypothetical protein MTR67_038674 [Solanum verrucosum]